MPQQLTSHSGSTESVVGLSARRCINSTVSRPYLIGEMMNALMGPPGSFVAQGTCGVTTSVEYVMSFFWNALPPTPPGCCPRPRRARDETSAKSASEAGKTFFMMSQGDGALGRRGGHGPCRPVNEDGSSPGRGPASDRLGDPEADARGRENVLDG